MGYTVGEVARLSHVSVRTLHHYDKVGLLTPSGRSPGGYRLYSDADLARLRQILVYRELEFGLDEIARMLSDRQASIDHHLRRQHRLVRQRQAHLGVLLGAVEQEMEARHLGLSLTPEEQFEIFGTDRIGSAYAAEAERRWGGTAAWKESRRRVAAYSNEDWLAIRAEEDVNLEAFARSLRMGEGPRARGAMDLAKAHRGHISRWFYECSDAVHRNLATMYGSDARFADHFDKVEDGLAQYVHDAIIAHAERATGSSSA